MFKHHTTVAALYELLSIFNQQVKNTPSGCCL